jgi:hypothetical protein
MKWIKVVSEPTSKGIRIRMTLDPDIEIETKSNSSHS